MSIVTRTLKSGQQIIREIRTNGTGSGLALAEVTETKAGKSSCTLYWVRRQPSDFGIAFTVEKPEDGTVYDVCLNMPGGGHSCTCAWGCYGSHKKPCRHVEACLQATREKKI